MDVEQLVESGERDTRPLSPAWVPWRPKENCASSDKLKY